MNTYDDNTPIKWSPADMVEVNLMEPDDFLKILESLTRIGICNENKLYQTCHILHKRGKYYIMHFKEMFMLDGEISTYTEMDRARRNTIIALLQNWGLCDVVDQSLIKDQTTLKTIKIIPFKDKSQYELHAKYSIGQPKPNRVLHQHQP